MTARRDDEYQLQKAIWQHIMLLKPANVIAYAVPNGEHRSKRTGARLKAMGVVAGVPDFAFVLADGRAAFLELKSSRGRLSPGQKAFADQCLSMEVEYAVSADLDTCLNILTAWGVIVMANGKE